MTTESGRTADDEGLTDDGEFVATDDAAIGRALRLSLMAAVVLAIVAGGLWWFVGRPEDVAAPTPADVGPALVVASREESPSVPFTDVTIAAGVTFVHENAARGGKLLPETMGAGVAFLDVDDDGDPDLLFANAQPWPGDAARPDRGDTPALYLNDGAGAFTDASEAWGLDESLFGTGIGVCDVDGDGDRDVLLTAVGPNRFLRHEGERFVDGTETAGLAGGEADWSSSAGFFDADNDGDLDLFVANYVHWSAEVDQELDYKLVGVGRAYGPPTSFEGAHSRFYLNDGAGVFRDVSAGAGVEVLHPATGVPVGKALGLVPFDLGGDGWTDVIVANDTVRNFLFRNDRDGTFTEIGDRAGLAYDLSGNATGAMGIDIADPWNDGLLAVAVGNFANEMTSFFVADRDPWMFADVARVEGIGGPSRAALSFGVFFFDADLDGRLDMLQTNGHLEDEINTVQPSQHYRQPSQLFWNAGADARPTFVELADDDIGDLSRAIVGRAAAYADVDADGDLDVVVTQSGDTPLLLRNDQDEAHHWLRVKLVGPPGAVEAIGARVQLTAGDVTQRRVVLPTRSYLSQVELPVTFGLGDVDTVEELVVRWPDGTEQVVPVEGVDRLLVVTHAD